MKRGMLISLGLAALGFAVFAAECTHDPRRAALSYLMAFACAVSIPLGALAWSMVCDACGAVWFVPLRRGAEAATATFPVLALLFLPIIAALGWLYPWVGAPAAAGDDAGWRTYLIPLGFALRAGICFACWVLIAEWQRHWSLRQERPGSPDLSHRRRALSAAGLLPLALTVTVAAIDWYMSLETTWRSTMYGLIHLVGDAVAGAAILVLHLRWSSRAGRLPDAVGAEHAHALGNLLLTGVLLWCYLSFMQFLVVWMADLPDEAAWYVLRIGPEWRWLALGLLLFHGIVPWIALLFRSVKRDVGKLAVVAVALLGMHYLDLYWQLAPALVPDDPWPRLSDVAALCAICGTVCAFGMWRAHGVAALPLNDPDLPAGLAYRTRA